MAPAPPCQTGQPCPKIEEAKLVVFIEFSKQLKVVCDPILSEINASGKALAIHAEQMRSGAARFEAIERNAISMGDRIDELESFRDTHAGEQQAARAAAQKEGKKAGRIWGVGLGLLGLLFQAIGWFWKAKSGG